LVTHRNMFGKGMLTKNHQTSGKVGSISSATFLRSGVVGQHQLLASCPDQYNLF
jgi:hypothetical protein